MLHLLCKAVTLDNSSQEDADVCIMDLIVRVQHTTVRYQKAQKSSLLSLIKLADQSGQNRIK